MPRSDPYYSFLIVFMFLGPVCYDNENKFTVCLSSPLQGVGGVIKETCVTFQTGAILQSYFQSHQLLSCMLTEVCLNPCLTEPWIFPVKMV